MLYFHQLFINKLIIRNFYIKLVNRGFLGKWEEPANDQSLLFKNLQNYAISDAVQKYTSFT